MAAQGERTGDPPGCRRTFVLAGLAGGALVLFYVGVLDRNVFNVRAAPARHTPAGRGLLPAQNRPLRRRRAGAVAEVATWLKANRPGDVIFVDQKVCRLASSTDPHESGAEERARQEGEVPARYLVCGRRHDRSNGLQGVGGEPRTCSGCARLSDADPPTPCPSCSTVRQLRARGYFSRAYTPWSRTYSQPHVVLAPDMAPAPFAFPPASRRSRSRCRAPAAGGPLGVPFAGGVRRTATSISRSRQAFALLG